jgi:outer membrane lipoprotein SlyB
MTTVRLSVLFSLSLLATAAVAGDLTTDAAIGGALGGAVGGALGAEVGGRQGAVIGAGVGAAAGTAINTKEYSSESSGHDGDRYERDRVDDGDSHYHHKQSGGSFCPPGQAKKGNC